MAHTADVGKKLAGGQRPLFLGKCRTVLLNRGVKIQFALLHKLHDRDSCDGFGNGAQPVVGRGLCGNEVFQIGHPVTTRPLQLVILHDGDGESRNVLPRHLGGDGTFDFLHNRHGESGCLPTEHGNCVEKDKQKEQLRLRISHGDVLSKISPD